MLWTAFGYLALPLADELLAACGGAALPLSARAALQLPLEVGKAFAVTRLLSSSLPASKPFDFSALVRRPAALALAGTAGALALGLVAAGSGEPPTGRAAQLMALLTGPPSLANVSLCLCGTLVAPYVEERKRSGLLAATTQADAYPAPAVFFRGWLLQYFRQGIQPAAAVALQAALFSAAHLGSSPAELVQRFLLGCVLGAAALAAEENLAAPMVGHALYNVVALASLAMLAGDDGAVSAPPP